MSFISFKLELFIGTNPFPKPMLTYRQLGSEALNLD